MDRDFTIVFEALDEASAGMEVTALDPNGLEADETAELQRLAAELSDPDSVSYFTT